MCILIMFCCCCCFSLNPEDDPILRAQKLKFCKYTHQLQKLKLSRKVKEKKRKKEKKYTSFYHKFEEQNFFTMRKEMIGL